MEAAGLQIVNVQELPTSTLSFDSAARGVANSGADYLFFLHEPGSNVAMARAMADTGYKGIKFAEYFSAYGTDFIEAAGAAAEGATSWVRTLPEEDGGANAEQRLYLRWMTQAVPGSTRDLFSADSWTSAKAFFDTLDALSGPITREALIAALHGIATYDAGGFMAPIRFGAERGNGCYIGMHVENGKWRRLVPASGFLC
jgi:ABC-type branched-subunit amino acid transport system substrate-binding protein